jgi:OmpA-OmpF porin, OOP family
MYRNLLFNLLIINGSVIAQSNQGADNLIPNPSFEQFDKYPIGWFYKGADFDRVMSYWKSPTGASPDAYSPKVHVPADWVAQGFGQAAPHSGQAMAGITTYGCVNGKSHCREYVQIQLREPLVIGQEYELRFWAKSLTRGLRVNNLGAYFSDVKINERAITDAPLEKIPQMNYTQVIDNQGEWFEIVNRMTATSMAEFITIGNFFTDAATEKRNSSSTFGPPFNFGYYYLDDVSLRKVPPILYAPVPPDDWTRIELQKNKIILLKNIYFDTDKADLLPRSNVELNKLLQIMIDNPTLRIEVRGHTDNQGGFEHNMQLSKRRAQQVVDFLISSGIARTRLQSAGFGSTEPLISNDLEENRQFNRRVEFQILDF